MIKKIYQTDKGPIHYWVSATCASDAVSVANTKTAANLPQLVFLPGLTADHRLFGKQVKHFEGKYRLFVWDAPGHAASYPFEMTFSLEEKARWLHEILVLESFDRPVIVGQSMGGYLGQMYAQLYPEHLRGFISIDSCSL